LPPNAVAERSIVFHAIRRIGDHQLRLHPGQHCLDVSGDGGITAEQAVTAEEPDIARHADRDRRQVGRLLGALGVFARMQQPVQLGDVESGQVEIEAETGEPVQFEPQRLLEPIGFLRHAIVGQAIGFGLRLAQSHGDMHGDSAQAEPLGGGEAGMADDDHARLVDHDRLAEAELAYRRRDFRNGLLGHLSGIALIRHDPAEFPFLDAHGASLTCPVRTYPRCRPANCRRFHGRHEGTQ
jgi:hypothetical protein